MVVGGVVFAVAVVLGIHFDNPPQVVLAPAVGALLCLSGSVVEVRRKGRSGRPGPGSD
jgi:hypothetical protein